MYIPGCFKNEDKESIKQFIAANGFASLISEVDGRPWASHIPLLLDTNEKGAAVLTGHVSKANKQWKQFDGSREVLAIFSGPQAYISSSWYNHENVPTWNYIAVHVYGKVRIVTGAELSRQLGRLVDKYEKGMKHPVSMEQMTPEFLAKEMNGITGFEIEITEIQAVSKLSQNRDAESLAGVIKGLNDQEDGASLNMAKILAANSKDQNF